ncbi:MAG: hypothetical protein WC572_00555 [Candidatus Omnitrophota bacterium]
MTRQANKHIFLLAGIILSAALSMPGCAKGNKEPPAPAAVKASVDKTAVSIGDKIKYTLSIEKDKGVEVELPVFGDNLGNFAIKDFGSAKKNLFSGREIISKWYILDTYITGKAAIPPAVIKYRKKGQNDWSRVESGEVSVEVKSLLGGSGEAVQMRGIKGPVTLPSPLNKIFIFAGLLFLCLLSGAYIYYARKKKGGQCIPSKPAHQTAYEQLEALKAKDYAGRGLIKEYYSEISDIIRHYLEDRFKLRAPEMTTEEFLAGAREAQELGGEAKNLLKEFLLCCDLVKFAKYAPSRDEADAIFDSAKNFIDQTKENEPA